MGSNFLAIGTRRWTSLQTISFFTKSDHAEVAKRQGLFSSQKNRSVNIFLCFYGRILIQYALLPGGNYESRAELNSTVDRKSIEKLRIRSAHIFTIENSYQNQRFVVRETNFELATIECQFLYVFSGERISEIEVQTMCSLKRYRECQNCTKKMKLGRITRNEFSKATLLLQIYCSAD